MSGVDAARAMATAADIVRETARTHERDRYLSALLAPAETRADLLALAAFAGELGRIPDTVSEPMIGEIRLQWWHDAIDAGIAPGSPATGNPIADAVVDAARRCSIPAALLHGLIDAQVQRLDDMPFSDLLGLDANLAAWDGGLFDLASRVLAATAGGMAEASPLLAEAGEIYGMARCLIEAPAALARGRVILPRELLVTHGITLDNARTPVASAGWQALQAELAARTGQRCIMLAQRYRHSAPSVRLAALPVALVRPYLQLTERIVIGALDARDVVPVRRVWRLWLASRTGRI
jgi:phytoene synthase